MGANPNIQIDEYKAAGNLVKFEHWTIRNAAEAYSLNHEAFKSWHYRHCTFKDFNPKEIIFTAEDIKSCSAVRKPLTKQEINRNLNQCIESANRPYDGRWI